MKTRVSGTAPSIRTDRTEIQVSPLTSGPVRESFAVMCEGKGRIAGTVSSDSPWVTVLTPAFDTTFIQRISLEINCSKSPGDRVATVFIRTNGETARVTISIGRSPEPVAKLRLDERIFQFCNIVKNEPCSFSITVRNVGFGLLTGTLTPLSDWIEIPTRGIWTRTTQVIRVLVHPAKAPQATHPIGQIKISTNGGVETVEVSLHQSLHKGPELEIYPSTVRIAWSLPGIIEETVTIRNSGSGVLRGTIPTKHPWVRAIPSIFSIKETGSVTIRADTRLLGDVPASTILDVITNAGKKSINVEIFRSQKTVGVRPQIRQPGRYRTRSRMEVFCNQRGVLSLISSGKSGGEGEIWFIEGDEKICVKLFHPHRITPEMEDKLRFMQKKPVHTPQGTSLCWPSGIVTAAGQNGRFLGYLMDRLDSITWKPVHSWYDNPEADPGLSTLAAARLASLVHAVHASGHCIGDLRENNIFISPSGEICIIDTDSFQIAEKGGAKTWYCRVGTGEYLPPELIDGMFELQDIDRLFADRFALAVLIFRFLMQGAHPFQARGPLVADAPTATDKILLGLFAYEGKITGLSPPEYAPPYSRIPRHIQTLFHEAFVTGHHNPRARPEPGMWADALGYQRVTSQEKLHMVQPWRREGPEPVRIKEYHDESGEKVTPGRRLLRIHHGEILELNRKGTHLMVPPLHEVQPAVCPINTDILPPSILLTHGAVYETSDDSIVYGSIIQAIDHSRFVHWHIAADPESRGEKWGSLFTFRHRVAACRNLISCLISIKNASLIPVSLSFRSVFVGPDSSVRVIASPDTRSGPDTACDCMIIQKTRELVTMMLMDGYNPDSIHRPLRIPNNSPGPETLPIPLRRIIFGTPEEQSKNLLINLQEWFKSFDLTIWSLVPCHQDPDHWYPVIPGWCPRCNQNGPWMRLLRGQETLMLLPGRIAGHLVQGKFSRRERVLAFRINKAPSETCLVIIIYPEIHPRFQVRGYQHPKLSPYVPMGSSIQTFSNNVALVSLCSISHSLVLYKEEEIPDIIQKAHLFLPYISLIDEIRWVSDLERMKGSLFPRLIKQQKISRRGAKRSYEIMIFPGDFRPAGSKRRREKGKNKVSRWISAFLSEVFG